ncbi:hypoxanthine phosphoribosyltransferase [Leptospira perolatii]
MRVLFDSVQIQNRIKELGSELGKDYQRKNPIFICVLKGGLYFFSDLTLSIPYSVEIDFIQARSYQGKKSTGKVELTKDIDSDLTDRHVVLVEDIVDTGQTLKFLIRHLLARSPLSLEIVSLLFKEEAKSVEYPIKYIGWKIPRDFVVGYGLDLDGKHRNLSGIYILEEKT